MYRCSLTYVNPDLLQYYNKDESFGSSPELASKSPSNSNAFHYISWIKLGRRLGRRLNASMHMHIDGINQIFSTLFMTNMHDLVVHVETMMLSSRRVVCW